MPFCSWPWRYLSTQLMLAAFPQIHFIALIHLLSIDGMNVRVPRTYGFILDYTSRCHAHTLPPPSF